MKQLSSNNKTHKLSGFKVHSLFFCFLIAFIGNVAEAQQPPPQQQQSSNSSKAPPCPPECGPGGTGGGFGPPGGQSG
ncbi:MAG: hypothetical protein WCP25_11160, partial [Polynucleobacter sp.]